MCKYLSIWLLLLLLVSTQSCDGEGLEVDGVEVGGEVVVIILTPCGHAPMRKCRAVGDEAERNQGGIEK